VQFQPRHAAFQKVVGDDIRECLEGCLATHSCLSEGDWLRVSVREQQHDLQVLNLRPASAVSVIGDVTVSHLPQCSLPACLTVCLFSCLSFVCLSLCLSFCLSIYMYVCMHGWLAGWLAGWLSSHLCGFTFDGRRMGTKMAHMVHSADGQQCLTKSCTFWMAWDVKPQIYNSRSSLVSLLS
jgi:hypothetical protein